MVIAEDDNMGIVWDCLSRLSDKWIGHLVDFLSRSTKNADGINRVSATNESNEDA